MDRDFASRIEAISVEAVAEHAAVAGRSVTDEVEDVRSRTKPLSVAEKLKLSKRLRAMTPADCLSSDSTDIVRWFRDTHGGRWTDDGWADDDRR